MLELFYSLLGMIIQFSVGAFRTNFDLFSVVVKNNDVIIWGVGIITNAVNVFQRLTLEQKTHTVRIWFIDAFEHLIYT